MHDLEVDWAVTEYVIDACFDHRVLDPSMVFHVEHSYVGSIESCARADAAYVSLRAHVISV